MSPVGDRFVGRGKSRDNSSKAKESTIYSGSENRLLQMEFREQRESVLR